jgi:hypothetical protein
VHVLYSVLIRIDGEHFATFAQQVNEITPEAAAGIEHAHTRRDVPAEDLIEEAAREAFEKFEAQLLLQILNLAGKRRLSHAQPARSAPVMLLFADRNEISQMP